MKGYKKRSRKERSLSRCGKTLMGSVIVILLTIVLTSPSAAASNSVSKTPPQLGLTTGSSSGGAGDPLIPPGYDVTFTCFYGTINLNGSIVCQNQQVLRDVCGVGTCWYYLYGSGLGRSVFLAWSSGGYDQSLTCVNQNCSETKLVVTLPTGVHQATGYVTISTSYPVTVTFVTFENWTTQWVPAKIQVCLGSTCQNESNGQTLSVNTNLSYSLTAVQFQARNVIGGGGPAYFAQWVTSAGSISNSFANPAQFTPTQAGNVSLIAGWANWAGYVYSPSTSGGVVSNVTAEFTLPGEVSQSGFAIWVGIGGMIGPNQVATNLWQAGVLVNASVKNANKIWAFWENCPGVGGCYNSNVHLSGSLGIQMGDSIRATVTTSGGISYFTIQDLSRLGKPKWSDHYTFVPNTQTGEWAMEALGSANGSDVYVGSMQLNGVPLTLYVSYLLEKNTVHSWTALGLNTGGGGPQFTLRHYG